MTCIDVLHYYFGCMFKYTFLNGDIIYAKLDICNDKKFMCGTVELIEEDECLRNAIKDVDDWYEIDHAEESGKLQLILTHPCDLTKDQTNEYKSLCFKIVDLKNEKQIIRFADTPLSMHYLFSNYIDAFDLIESGQAIDKNHFQEVILKNLVV